MKKSLYTGLLILIWMAVAIPSLHAAGYKLIDGMELEAMMKDGKPIVIVDVREPSLFSAGHIKGAINIPYNDAGRRILKELSPNDRIVFVCHSGPMGNELADILVSNGYKNVYNLKGGMWRWRGEVVK